MIQSLPIGGTMKFLKMAALFGLAVLPLLLMRKGKESTAAGEEVDSEHIFDQELSSD